MLMLDAEGEADRRSAEADFQVGGTAVQHLVQHLFSWRSTRTNVVGIVAVLGDHRGFGPHDVQAYEEVPHRSWHNFRTFEHLKVRRLHAPCKRNIVRTSLGGTTLLGVRPSHQLKRPQLSAA